MSKSLTYRPISEYPALQLFDLLLEPSPSGAENKVAERVKQTLNEWQMPHEQDAVGNVIVRLPGQNPEAPLCVLAAQFPALAFDLPPNRPSHKIGYL
jgi:acetylornithine deacetylase/succinyl-diaminopimelate desuccinylase-like protein